MSEIIRLGWKDASFQQVAGAPAYPWDAALALSLKRKMEGEDIVLPKLQMPFLSLTQRAVSFAREDRALDQEIPERKTLEPEGVRKPWRESVP